MNKRKTRQRKIMKTLTFEEIKIIVLNILLLCIWIIITISFFMILSFFLTDDTADMVGIFLIGFETLFIGIPLFYMWESKEIWNQRKGREKKLKK